MRPDRLLVLVAVVSLGCAGQLVPPGDGGATGGGAGGGSAYDGGVARSARNALRFKGDIRLTLDLAVGLQLPLTEVCSELGLYPCTTAVHAVALGGVDPYGKGLYEGATVTGVTTPVVVERVVLAACLRRVELDLATPGAAVIFRGIPLTDRRLTAPDGLEVRLALSELAHRAWLREPTARELAHLQKLYTDVEATGAQEPARTWMQAACFAVFSSAESVFY